MALKKYKPMTAGSRWRIGNAYAEITTNEPEKSLLEPKSKTGGRNAQGRWDPLESTCRHASLSIL